MKYFNTLLIILTLTFGLLSCAKPIDKSTIIPTTSHLNTDLSSSDAEILEDTYTSSDTTFWFISYEVGGKESEKGSYLYTERFAGILILKTTKDYFSIDETMKKIGKKHDNMGYRGVTFFKQVDRKCYLEWKNTGEY